MSCDEGLQNLEPTEQDLDRLRSEMDIVTGYWMEVDTELAEIETQVDALRDDHTLQMRIKGLTRAWTGVAQYHKSYIIAVRAIHA
jgi:hypothetical protein